MSQFDIGVPKEIKPKEGRVALMPNEVKRLSNQGYKIGIETNAGALTGIADHDYLNANAVILSSIAEIYEKSAIVMKVKEFLPPEYDLIKPDHILFTNIHSAANPDLTDILLQSKATAIAAEDTHEFGSPNCALAGEVGAFEGIRLCFAYNGGVGRHFFPHFGSQSLKVAVIGLGNVGRGALRVLLNLGCDVTGFDIHEGTRYRAGQDYAMQGLKLADISDFADALPDFDLVLNCVMWPKHRTDHLISRAQLKSMKGKAVICDISCDPGGAVETTRATSWDDPTYREEGILHFCVDNIPGAVPQASSAGYSNRLCNHVESILKNGWAEAARLDPWLARGVVCSNGILTHEETARVQSRTHTTLSDFLRLQEN